MKVKIPLKYKLKALNPDFWFGTNPPINKGIDDLLFNVMKNNIEIKRISRYRIEINGKIVMWVGNYPYSWGEIEGVGYPSRAMRAMFSDYLGHYFAAKLIKENL